MDSNAKKFIHYEELSRELSGKFYYNAIRQSDTVCGNHIIILPNIKNKLLLNRLDLGNALEADSAKPISSDSIIYNRSLETVPLKVVTEFHIPNIKSDCMSRNVQIGSYDGSKISENEVARYWAAVRIGNQLEKLIWAGDTAAGSNNLIDGFLKIMDADANTVKVSAPITITPANVLAELERGYNLVPDAILNSPDLRLYVSMPVWRAYTIILGTNALNYRYNKQKGSTQLFYKGIEVVAFQGMESTSKYVFAEKNNLFYGTDLVSDFDNIKIIDLEKKTGEPKVRVVGKFKSGVQYAVSQEVVIY